MIHTRRASGLLRLSFTFLLMATPITAGASLPPPRVANVAAAPETPAAAGDVIGPCAQGPSTLFLPLLTRGAGGPAASLSVSLPACRMLVQGYSGSMTVAVVIPAGSGPVSLALQGAPAGMAASFIPAGLSASGAVTLTLSVGASVAPGAYPLAVQAQAGGQAAAGAFRVQVVEPLDIQGSLAFDTGAAVAGAQVNVRTEDGQAVAGATSAAGGAYSVKLPALQVPARVLVSAAYSPTGLPAVANARWQLVENRGVVSLGTLRLPNPAGAQLTLAGGQGQSSNGALRVSGLPGSVAKVYGRNYDPDYHRDVFPGDFTENGQVPLNSAGFLWIEALDAAGNPIDQFASAVTIRSRIPRAQWADLVDTTPGTDRIEVPIYTYDETAQMWQWETTGWLEDSQQGLVAEAAQSLILAGSLAGDLFATFSVTHFSFKNLDYPHIGPWDLSGMDPDKRNNECTQNAFNIANRILHSQKGHDAYRKVNKPDADIDEEFRDGKGPKVVNVSNERMKQLTLKNRKNSVTVGGYMGESGGPEDTIFANDLLWSECGPNATDEQKLISAMWIAVTVLHETAHWKQDVIKEPSLFADTGDKDGVEEGSILEGDLFGGSFTHHLDTGQPTLNGNPVDIGTIKQWLDPNNWPPPAPPQPNQSPPEAPALGAQASPLQVTLALTKTTFAMGEQVPVQVTFTNVSSAPLQVLSEAVLEGWPLHFDLIHQGTGRRAPFLGPAVRLSLEAGAFETLPPNASLTQMFYLLSDPETGGRHYQLYEAGTYRLSAVYQAVYGMPPTGSNELTLTVQPGGGLAGQVTNAATGQPVTPAGIRVSQGGQVLAKVDTAPNGNYNLSLPPGSYTVEARAHGYGSGRQDGVAVTVGQTATVNFSLPRLPSNYFVAVGQVISDGVPTSGAGRIEVPLGKDTYIFEAAPGQRVFFDVQSHSAPSLDPVGWELVDDDGNLVFGSCLGCPDAGTYALRRGGLYALTVGDDLFTGTGTYRLQLWDVPPPSRFALSLGGVISDGVPGPGAGMIESPGATDIYTFTASAGQQVFFDRLAAAVGVDYVEWQLEDAGGTEVFTRCLGCGDVGKKTLVLGGTYTLTVGNDRDDGVGAYRLRLWDVPPSSLFNISVGDVITNGVPGPGAGMVETPGAVDIYTFTASAGQQVFFDLLARDPDVGLVGFRLVDANGTEIFDSYLGALDPGMKTLTLGGPYTLTVGSDVDDGFGAYSFKLE